MDLSVSLAARCKHVSPAKHADFYLLLAFTILGHSRSYILAEIESPCKYRPFIVGLTSALSSTVLSARAHEYVGLIKLVHSTWRRSHY